MGRGCVGGERVCGWGEGVWVGRGDGCMGREGYYSKNYLAMIPCSTVLADLCGVVHV